MFSGGMKGIPGGRRFIAKAIIIRPWIVFLTALVMAAVLAGCGGPRQGITYISKAAGTPVAYVVRLDGREWTRFEMPELGGVLPEVRIDGAEDGWRHVLFSWAVPKEIPQDELSVHFEVLFSPDFWWAPHLSPQSGDVIAQHVFRSPCLIVAEGRSVLTVVPAFIVNQTQSPNYPGEPSLREFLSIWNQAWFSSLRSASGVFRYARRVGGRPDLSAKASLTEEFALAAPLKDGLFPSVYRTEMTTVKIGGREYRRSLGWQTGTWTNSDRSPRERGITDRWYHLLDASWTALLMLRWYEELEKDPRLLTYAQVYGDKLITLQDTCGFFPAWLDPETLGPSPVLADSPETSQSVTFLLKLARLTSRNEYRDAAVRAMDAVIREVVSSGRWEDFETYWSCNPFWRDRPGQKVERNGMYKQNTFSMFWTAEALLETYLETGDKMYLLWGRRTLDELSIFQQTWQPPFIYVPALGGFGVMNYYGEWNDSRQCLFAELFMRYYRETGDPNLFERGIAALKSAFIMMYCPENPKAKAQWEKVHPFFGPADYGFTMENYGHGGETSEEGMGMGVFTINDWGNGASAEAWNRIYEHFGSVYIDGARGKGFGIDSISVRPIDGGAGGYELMDMSGASGPREIRVVFEDGPARTVTLAGAAIVK